MNNQFLSVLLSLLVVGMPVAHAAKPVKPNSAIRNIGAMKLTQAVRAAQSKAGLKGKSSLRPALAKVAKKPTMAKAVKVTSLERNIGMVVAGINLGLAIKLASTTFKSTVMAVDTGSPVFMGVAVISAALVALNVALFARGLKVATSE